jgi:hypothetical protein
MPQTTVQKEVALGNAINAYIVEMAEEWQMPIRNALELETMIDTVYCLETYAETHASFENVVQAYQGKFTPSGNVAIGAVKNTLGKMKSDLHFTEDQFEQFGFSQYPDYHPAGQSTMEDNKFVQKLLNEFYINQWIHEINEVSVHGVAVAPTVGTAGTVLGSCNGFNKIFADGIVAGNVNTVNTGIITEADIYDQLQSTMDAVLAVQPKFAKMGGSVYMSPEQVIWYSRKYAAKHNNATPIINDPSGTFLLVDNYKKFKIRELTEKGNDDIWVDIHWMGKTNMICLKHKKYSDMPSLTAYPEARGLKLTSSWHRGFGLRRKELTYLTRA